MKQRCPRIGVRLQWLALLVACIFLSAPIHSYATEEVFSSSTTWTCPAGVTSVTVEAWAGGGGGSGGNGSTSTGGGGGGGGQYVKQTVSVTESANYDIIIGAGGTAGSGGSGGTSGGNGGNTTFNVSDVIAIGGSGGVWGAAGAGGAGGTGGSWDLSYDGGTGATGSNGTVFGGGGGGGAGSAGAGTTATDSNGGAGGTPDGGNGGAGSVLSNGVGTAGSPYGGGGGAGTRNSSGAAGAAGYIRLTYSAAADTLTVTANMPVATAAAPGQAGVLMQYLQVDSDGEVEITTVTVDDLGTATTGDINTLNIYIDDDTDLGNGYLAGPVFIGSWDGTSTPVDISAMAQLARTVTNGTSKYIWITYDLNAGISNGTTLRSSVTSIAVLGPDSGASGTWSSNNITTASGPASTITSCAGCHDYPPADGARSGSTGAVYGSHSKHTAYSTTCDYCHPSLPVAYGHRDGKIELKSGNIGQSDTSDNGTYATKGSLFDQVKNPTTYTCSDVNCHYNNTTPVWGTTGIECNGCHTLPPTPPTEDAHAAHYAAKNWAADTANCTVCHPNNSPAHSDVKNGIVEVLGGLGYAGGSCSTADGPGCHNGQPSLAWTTTPGTITCTDCHTVGGSNTGTVANPVSGLHNLTASNTTAHNGSFGAGYDCENCHDKGSISEHWNGIASDTADYDKAAVGIISAMYTDASGTAATRGSCMSNTDLASCHTDKGEWRRLWSTDADTDIVASKLPGQAVCNVCHGQYDGIGSSTGWNEGTVHYRSGNGAAENKGIIHTDPGDECEDCHGYDSVSAGHNNNNMIDFSDGDGEYTVTLNTVANPDVWYCANCHNNQGTQDGTLTDSRTFLDSLAFPNSVNHVTGSDSIPSGSCFGCHGDGVEKYWPQNAGNVRSSTLYDDYNNAGAHQRHIEVLAARLGISLPGLDAEQKTMCGYCHTVGDGDHMKTGASGELAEVFPGNAGTSLWGNPDTSESFDNATSFNCTNVDCHNSKDTTATYSWYSGNTSTCTLCHTVGAANTATNAHPSSGIHSAARISGTLHDDSFSYNNGGSTADCVTCHTSSPTTGTNKHIDGTNDYSISAADAVDPRVNLAAAVGFTDAVVPTCSPTQANGCHMEQWNAVTDHTWTRLWHENAGDNTGAECKGCHGTFTQAWTAGVTPSHTTDYDGNNGAEIRLNHDHGAGTETEYNQCITCHVYNDGAYGTLGWNPTAASKHGNGQIEMLTGMGYATASNTCATTCHDTLGGSHAMTPDSGWTVTNLAGPDLSCGLCHTGGVTTSAVSGAHAIHNADNSDLAGSSGTDCANCHGASAATYTSALSGAHGDGSVTFSNVTYNHAGTRNDTGGTCTTSNCHNKGADPSTLWESSALACDDCHYYELTVVNNTNNSNHAAALSNRHDTHLNKAIQCATCHTVPGAEDTVHITGTSLSDRATAAFGEAAVGGSKLITYLNPNCTANFDGLGCHATSTSEAWNQAQGTITCMDCHTDTTTSSVNPTTGLHGLTAAGTTAHNGSFGSGYGCDDCHQNPASGAHATGILNTPATATFYWNTTSKTITLGTLSDNTDDTCTASVCHTDGGDWTRLWSTAADSTATAVGSARCNVCHGQFNNWRAGTSHAAAYEQNRGDSHNSRTGIANGCEDCHVYPSVISNHNDGSININDNAGVASASSRTWCADCHSNDGDPATADTRTYEQSTFPRVEVAGAYDPVGACTACHAAGKSGAIVTASSPHVVTTVGGTFGACTDCHPGGNIGTMHSATSAIAVANNTNLGINYVNGTASYSGYNGVVLGGDSANPSGLSEAEWCWACHQAATPDISEWDGSSATYDYGYVDQGDLNWTTTNWYSANFSYKNGPLYTRPIRSTSTNAGDDTSRGDASLHATGGTVGTQSNTLSLVRCSYCHNVHSGAAPFLRYAWKSNPYKEDGAPRTSGGSGVTYGATQQFGAVPRGGGSNLTLLGGWQIDSNNGNPNTTYAYTTDDLLCSKCHTQSSIETAAPLHKNAVKGFTNDTATARNILRVGDSSGNGTPVPRGGTLTAHTVDTVGNPKMGYYVAGDTTGTTLEQDGIREVDRDGEWINATTGIYDAVSAKARYGYRGFPAATAGATGVTQDLTTVQTDFHSFSCSKCHNPHASRLPRLMITNCLDVNNNTWDDTLNPTDHGGTSPYSRTTANNPANIDQLAYFSSAQNCHIYTENASGTARGTVIQSGWNLVTPW